MQIFGGVYEKCTKHICHRKEKTEYLLVVIKLEICRDKINFESYTGHHGIFTTFNTLLIKQMLQLI